MATTDQHHAKWLHNRTFLSTIQDPFSDWMVTVAFYTAVHAVESLFSADGAGNHTSHVDRHQTLKKVNRYKKIWYHFRPLYEAAQIARYYCGQDQWLPLQTVKASLIGNHLYQIEKSVLKLRKMDQTMDPVFP